MPSIDRFINGGYMIYPRGTFGTNYYLFNKVIGSVPDVTYKDNYNKVTLKTFGKYPAIFYVGETNYKTFSLQTVFTSDQNAYNYANTTKYDSLATRYPQWEIGIRHGVGDIIQIWSNISNSFIFYRCVAIHTSDIANMPPNLLFWTLTSVSSGAASTVVGENEDSIVTTAYDDYIRFKRQIDQRIPWVIRGSISGEDFVCDIEITSTIHNQNSIIRKGGNVEDQRHACDDIFFSDFIQITIECTEIDDYIYPDPDRGISGDGPEDRFNIWGES